MEDASLGRHPPFGEHVEVTAFAHRRPASQAKSARKLRTYLTSLGFFDEEIGVIDESSPASLGHDNQSVPTGLASEVDDPGGHRCNHAKTPGILGLPVGSNAPFKEHTDLPNRLPGAPVKSRPAKIPCKANRRRTNTTVSGFRWVIRNSASPEVLV